MKPSISLIEIPLDARIGGERLGRHSILSCRRAAWSTVEDPLQRCTFLDVQRLTAHSLCCQPSVRIHQGSCVIHSMDGQKCCTGSRVVAGLQLHHKCHCEVAVV